LYQSYSESEIIKLREKMIQMTQTIKRLAQVATLAIFSSVALQLSGCSSPMPSRAPVEDRSTGSQGGASSSTRAPTDAPVLAPIDSKPLPNLTNSQNAGKPGFYTVKPGDTIMQVGRTTGQNWRDIVKWNNLDNPNQVETGQVLRVAPPEGAVKPPVVAAPVTPAPTTPAASAPAGSDDDIAWLWPSSGALIAGYDDVKSKGLKIGGKLGDPIFASADGRVVYAGSAVRGYGNLVILKHNETYLTAYAHNQTLLVKEDQTVRKGQRIADMGNSDAERVMLHFEVRRNGKPVDPAKYLPGR
jgi:lipoprotein NlpD